MKLEAYTLLANLLLSVTVSTLVVALIAYGAYKLRELRKPDAQRLPASAEEDGPVFLRVYEPTGDMGREGTVRQPLR